jgi:hypothetical protein
MSYGQASVAWKCTGATDILVGHSHFQFTAEAGRSIKNAWSQWAQRAAQACPDDDERIISRRLVWYGISATQRAMADIGLPPALINRLSAGR